MSKLVSHYSIHKVGAIKYPMGADLGEAFTADGDIGYENVNLMVDQHSNRSEELLGGCWAAHTGPCLCIPATASFYDTCNIY